MGILCFTLGLPETVESVWGRSLPVVIKAIRRGDIDSGIDCAFPCDKTKSKISQNMNKIVNYEKKAVVLPFKRKFNFQVGKMIILLK